MNSKTVTKLAILTATMTCLATAPTVVGDEKKEKGSKTKKQKVGALLLNVPETWKFMKPKSRFRAGQFQVPAAKGDPQAADLIVYYFGKNSGGGIDANIERWEGQFSAKQGKSKVTRGKTKDGHVYVVLDLSGTYDQPVGPPALGRTKPMKGARMLAVILTVKSKGNYFLKFTGATGTVTAAAAAFRKSFGADAKKEKKYVGTQF